jgi:ElaB/YqjD/DUF883 family membrane-anchored ribosome-binding protein
MATRQKSSKSRSTGARAGRGRSSGSSNSRGGGSASSMVLQLVGSVVGDSLSETVSNLKNKVTEQVEIHGQEYLETAHERITDATAKVVKWGKEHPVKTVAAAAALIAVAGFLYATLHGKAGQVAKATKQKLKAASAAG